MKLWNQRAASHETVVAAQPRIGSAAPMKTGSAIASTIRSRLRTIRIPTPASDVLKACVDNPESKEESRESAHEGKGHGCPEGDPIPYPIAATSRNETMIISPAEAASRGPFMVILLRKRKKRVLGRRQRAA